MVESKKCDRHYSRSAREILRDHLVTTWQDTYRTTGNTKYSIDVSEWNVWQLLDATLKKDDNNDKAKVQQLPRDAPLCPLLPNYDILKEQEEASLIISGTIIPRSIMNSAIPGIAHYRLQQQKSKKQHVLYPVIYHCNLCQKKFTSQYYLDRHLDNQHPLNHTTTICSEYKICPADTYCSFLSPLACYDHTILYEPHYGPGSDNLEFRSLQQQTQTPPPCIDQIQRDAIMKCYEIISLCFYHDTIFQQILGTNMCSNIPSCRTRIMRQMMNTLSSSSTSSILHNFSFDDWFEIWNDTHNNRSLSFWISLVIFIFTFAILYRRNDMHIFTQNMSRKQNYQRRNRQIKPSTINRNVQTPTAPTTMLSTDSNIVSTTFVTYDAQGKVKMK
jgi:hypothetical protein